MHAYFFLFADHLEIQQLLVKSGVESLVVPSSQSVEMDFVEKNSSEKHYRLSFILNFVSNHKNLLLFNFNITKKRCCKGMREHLLLQ